jgi:hypothetical protein
VVALSIYFLISYKILIFLMLEKQLKHKKGKKVHAVFNQVGFMLILYGEYNGN